MKDSKCWWILFHNWGKWTRPFKGYNGDCTQYSECKDCGRVKSREASFQYGGQEGGKAVSMELEKKDE